MCATNISLSTNNMALVKTMCSCVVGLDSGANHIKTSCVYNTFGAINISCRVVIDGCCFWMSSQNKCVATAECLLVLPTATIGHNDTDFWSFNILSMSHNTTYQMWNLRSQKLKMLRNCFHSHLIAAVFCFWGHAEEGRKELAYSYFLNEYWLVCCYCMRSAPL